MSTPNLNANAAPYGQRASFDIGDIIRVIDPNDSYAPLGDLMITAVDYNTNFYHTKTAHIDMTTPSQAVQIPARDVFRFTRVGQMGFYAPGQATQKMLPVINPGYTATVILDEAPLVGCCGKCGKEKVWYTPFRGERERVCPACPKHG